jgi:hypothetical protein
MDTRGRCGTITTLPGVFAVLENVSADTKSGFAGGLGEVLVNEIGEMFGWGNDGSCKG